jgi:hypothetical protein
MTVLGLFHNIIGLKKETASLWHFAAHCQYVPAQIQLKGIEKTKNYVFTDEDTHATIEVSGSTLCDKPFSVELFEKRSSMLLFYCLKG